MSEPAIDRFPPPFGFYRYVLNGDHLHFGFWPDSSPHLSMRKAQEAMFKHLLSFFPPPPASILDVGCGLGLSSFLLSNEGYHVTAIAPTPEMIHYASQTYRHNLLDFKMLGFFDEDKTVFREKGYDIIFFQESPQYLNPLDAVIKKSRFLLKDKGLIIMGDEVCYDPSLKTQTSVHMANDFTIALAEQGFRIMENQKIGKNVLPTCDFIIRGLADNSKQITSVFHDRETPEQLLKYLNGWKKQKEWYTNGQFGYELFIARKDSFFTRPYKPGDEIQILELFREVFCAERSIEHWNWKFRDNPYGKFMISETFSDTGRLIAHYGGYLCPLYNETCIGPQTFFVCHVGDTMTKADVRNIGLGKTNLLSRTVDHCYTKYFEKQMPFAYGFNTGKIKILGKRYLGYSYLDEVIFRVRDILGNPFMKPGWSRMFSKFRVEEVYSLTTEWDDFFNRVCHSYKFLVKRDSRYLKWRYLDCPDKDYKIFSVRRSGKLVGFSVFLKNDKRLIWGDALFDNRYPEAITHLLRFVQDCSIGTRMEHIEGWFSKNPAWWHEILNEICFVVREEPNRLSFCYKIFDKPDMSEVLDKFLYYTLGDSDLF